MHRHINDGRRKDWTSHKRHGQPVARARVCPTMRAVEARRQAKIAKAAA